MSSLPSFLPVLSPHRGKDCFPRQGRSRGCQSQAHWSLKLAFLHAGVGGHPTLSSGFNARTQNSAVSPLQIKGVNTRISPACLMNQQPTPTCFSLTMLPQGLATEDLQIGDFVWPQGYFACPCLWRAQHPGISGEPREVIQFYVLYITNPCQMLSWGTSMEAAKLAAPRS